MYWTLGVAKYSMSQWVLPVQMFLGTQQKGLLPALPEAFEKTVDQKTAQWK